MSTQSHAGASGGGHDIPVTLSLDSVSAASRLLQKRQEMKEVQRALNGQKSLYAKKEKMFKRREEALRKKDVELQEALVLFNAFLKENEMKRMKNEKKAMEFKLEREQAEKQRQICAKQLKSLTIKCDKTRSTFQKIEKYQLYLQSVLNSMSSSNQSSGDDFSGMPALTLRYQCLDETNHDLVQYQEQITKDIEETRAKLHSYVAQHNTQILNYNNEIAYDTKQLESIMKETVGKAVDVEDRLKHRLECTSEATQVLMAVENLFQRCNEASKELSHPEKKLTSKELATLTESQQRLKIANNKLDVICAYIKDFDDIVQTYRAQERYQRYQQQQANDGSGLSPSASAAATSSSPS